MRLFIAVKMDEAAIQALSEIQTELNLAEVDGNYTPPENLHMTLAFIGEYPNPVEVLDLIDSVPFEPLDIRLQGIGTFDKIWWIGIEKNGALEAYVKRLRHALADADIPFDKKSFTPHITIIRGAACETQLPEIHVPDITIHVDHISLMRSDFGKHRMIYTELN